MFLVARTMQFWQPCRNKLDTRPESFRSTTENVKNNLSFPNFFPQSFPTGTQPAVLTTQSERTYQRATTFSPLVWKWYIDCNLFWTVFFVELFLWTCKLQFWQTCRKKNARKPAKVWSMSQVCEKIKELLEKIFCSEIFLLATYNTVLSNPLEKFRQKEDNFSLHVRG